MPQELLDQVQLEKLISASEIYIRFSSTYMNKLKRLSEPYEYSEKNTSPLITLKEGSYCLRNAYRLVQIYKDCVPGTIDNENIKSVNDMLVALEFDLKHIASDTRCFTSKGQGTKYYKLLHSKSKEDVRSFIEIVERNIDPPVRRFLHTLNDQLKAIKIIEISD